MEGVTTTKFKFVPEIENHWVPGNVIPQRSDIGTNRDFNLPQSIMVTSRDVLIHAKVNTCKIKPIILNMISW